MPDDLDDDFRNRLSVLDDLPHRPGAQPLMQRELTVWKHEDAEDEKLATAEAAEAAALAGAEQALEVSDEVLDGEPPAAIEVGAEGLPPQRARLVRFRAWWDAKRADLDSMEAGRTRLPRIDERARSDGEQTSRAARWRHQGAVRSHAKGRRPCPHPSAGPEVRARATRGKARQRQARDRDRARSV